eukprot:CAMPEP_0178970418 /NCGR_PEP_ID=MMETSP0789-20121207/19528_1 /TAXON_ID=3005 /ORGANISM="Rhizosolenia setigera, Strain CCMP 1694" /LENGTH=134 /DNA_ID=CAMNT_0020656915 /DNA_START=65 /DNA_END=466 /DNA_ORIENTATION=-
MAATVMPAKAMPFESKIDLQGREKSSTPSSNKRARRRSSGKSGSRRSKRDSLRRNESTSRTKLVKFNRPIVTDVKEIPLCNTEDRARLFYSEEDIAKFRMKTEKKKARHKTIRFAPELVSDIVYFPPISKDSYW